MPKWQIGQQGLTRNRSGDECGHKNPQKLERNMKLNRKEKMAKELTSGWSTLARRSWGWICLVAMFVAPLAPAAIIGMSTDNFTHGMISYFIGVVISWITVAVIERFQDGRVLKWIEHKTLEDVVWPIYRELLTLCGFTKGVPHWKNSPWLDWKSDAHPVSEKVNEALALFALKTHQENDGEAKKKFWRLVHLANILNIPLLRASDDNRGFLPLYAVCGMLLDEEIVTDPFAKGNSYSPIWGKDYRWQIEERIAEAGAELLTNARNDFVRACNGLLAGYHGTLLVAVAALKTYGPLQELLKEAMPALQAIEEAADHHMLVYEIINKACFKGSWLSSVVGGSKSYNQKLWYQLCDDIPNEIGRRYFDRDREIDKNKQRRWVKMHDVNELRGFPGHKKLALLWTRPGMLTGLLAQVFYTKEEVAS